MPVDDPKTVGKTLAYYDANAAEVCARYETANPQAAHDLLLKTFPPQCRVLELGAGSGRDGAFLLAQGYDWTGLDASASMMAQAALFHPECDGRLLLHDMQNPLPFRDDSFQGILSLAAMMHLCESSLPFVLGEAMRVLVPGGAFIISVPIGRMDTDAAGYTEDGRYFLPWNEEKWAASLAENGFCLDLHIRNADSLGRDIQWITFRAHKPQELER